MKGHFSKEIVYKFFRYILTLCFILFFAKIWANGLRINGNAYPISKRSSAEISFDQLKGLKSFENGNLQLTFQLALDERSNQGGIFKLKFADSDQVISMNLKSTRSQKIEFSLNLEGNSVLGQFIFDKSQLKIQQWFPVDLRINLSEGKITWKVLNQRVVISTVSGLRTKILPQQLIFGKNGYSIDVADYTIKDVSLSDGMVQCGIPLKERGGDIIHDDRGNRIGKTVNASWLAPESFFWEKWKTIKLNAIGGYQMDQERGRFIVFSQDSLWVTDLYAGNESVYPMPHNLPFRIQLGNSFLLNNKLYIYEVNNLPQDICSIVQIDLDNLQSVCVSKRQLPMQLHHHTGQALSQSDYLIFGGFGNERYNGDFLKLNTQNGIWDTLHVSGDKIYPRYFTSSFVDKAKYFYVFAGMGNTQGNNNLGRNYYYDLYRFDVDKQAVKKVWELDWKAKNKVPVRQLVYDGKKNFYSLMYSEYESSSFLQLYQFSIDNPHYQALGDSIPIKSDKIKTNANLFQFEPLNRFYAVTEVYDNEEVKSEVVIYRLRLPVLTAGDWNKEREASSFSLRLWLLVFGGITGLVFYWKFKKGKGNVAGERQKVEKDTGESSAGMQLLTDDFIFPATNCIHLFGEFKVTDAKGVDITHLFKGKVKHLLILILLHDPNRGISSELISSLLWPDKEYIASKNIRNVTLNHLRKSLEYMDGIKLVYGQSFYKIELNGTYVDSCHFKTIIGQHTLTNELWTILNRGQFLPKESVDGLDTLKSLYEQEIIDFLMQQIKLAYSENELKIALQLIHILYVTDPVSLEALKIEINIWKKMGDEAKAKKSYQKFQKRYSKWMGTEYLTSFESIFHED
ncbi:Kelch repeat-containing protein [Sphingobacterium sp.]|uniref:Kelch repeat-containing protein n=1 Tax=Sphingobacterium sp. TaxID=341027 RepID=UPI002FDDCB08